MKIIVAGPGITHAEMVINRRLAGLCKGLGHDVELFEGSLLRTYAAAEKAVEQSQLTVVVMSNDELTSYIASYSCMARSTATVLCYAPKPERFESLERSCGYVADNMWSLEQMIRHKSPKRP